MPSIIINPLLNSTPALDEVIEVSEGLDFIVDEPHSLVPEGLVGFHILTARDGGKRLVWRSDNFAQLLEARNTFNDLLAKGMVAFYVDSEDGKPIAEKVMDLFDPAEGMAWMEDVDKAKAMINKINKTLVAPVQRAVGG